MSLCPFSLLPPCKSRRKQPTKRRRREQSQHSIHVRRVRREQPDQRHTHPERRSAKQRQYRRPPFSPRRYHRTAEGRKAGARPRRLPYSCFIQSAAHRQIGRKRQQHQIYPHRRRQAERDRSHCQSFLLLHSIALPIPVVQKSVCRKAAFYIQTLEKSVQKSADHSAGAFASG